MAASECRDLETLLQPYVDGEFEADDKVQVEVHLAHCEPCRLRVESERLLRHRLREAAAVSAPAALRGRIAVGLKNERRWGNVHSSLRAAAVAAMAAAAGFAAYLELPQLFAPLLDDAVDRHAKNLPVEVAGDALRVERWFQGKVDFNVQVPRLRNVSLQGGRLSHIGDHSAAYVVYGGPNARRVSLFVFDDPRAPIELGLNPRRRLIDNREVVLANARGYNVAAWHDKEIVYSLVSDVDEHDLVSMLNPQPTPVMPPSAPAVIIPPAMNDSPPGSSLMMPASLHLTPR